MSRSSEPSAVIGRKPRAHLLVGQPLQLSSLATHPSALRHSPGCWSCTRLAARMVKTGLGRLGRNLRSPQGRALSGAAAMAATHDPRPLSPHLTIWRWGPHMVVSILHRATGAALSIAGLAILTWWLMALAQGPEAYATFAKAAQQPARARSSWSASPGASSSICCPGIRHLVMDTGAAFELGVNKTFAILTIVGSIAPHRRCSGPSCWECGHEPRRQRNAARARSAASARRARAASIG